MQFLAAISEILHRFAAGDRQWPLRRFSDPGYLKVSLSKFELG